MAAGAPPAEAVLLHERRLPEVARPLTVLTMLTVLTVLTVLPEVWAGLGPALLYVSYTSTIR